jgi:1-deoxy-D-xylulose-5-phosphate reductoisomerase
MAIDAGAAGGTLPTVLSAADETAVSMFLKGQIRFADISCLVEQALTAHTPVARPCVEDILAAARWARQTVSLHVVRS